MAIVARHTRDVKMRIVYPAGLPAVEGQKDAAGRPAG